VIWGARQLLYQLGKHNGPNWKTALLFGLCSPWLQLRSATIKMYFVKVFCIRHEERFLTFKMLQNLHLYPKTECPEQELTDEFV